MNIAKLTIVIGAAFLCFVGNAQQGFTIRGTIKMVTGSHSVVIDGGDGSFKGAIQRDGSFTISGQVKEPGFYLIHTDSSGSNLMWLENAEYHLACKEIDGPNFRIDQLEGPLDAKLYYAFSEPRFYIRGTSKEDYAIKWSNFYTNIIDSIFRVAPQSVVLPDILRLTIGGVSDEKMQAYLQLLDTVQRKDGSFSQINYYYKRKEKIATEKTFEDFIMKDSTGKDFALNQVNKKLILIDFWSSDCFPCRRKHVRLAELYKKYSDKGLEIVSVSLDDDASEWKKAIIKDNMTWINVSELKGWNTPLAERYYVKSLPYAFWLDGSKRFIGEQLSNEQIEKILNE